MSTTLVLGWIVLASGAAPGVPEASLPPEGCVRLLRQARIDLMQDDGVRALASLWSAVEAYPDEVAPLLALAELRRSLPLSEDDESRYRTLLRARLLDPKRPVRVASLRHLVQDPHADPEVLALARDGVEARLAASPDSPALLDALASLHVRVDDPEAAREILGRLYRVRPSDDVAWRLIEIDRRLGRWEHALELLAPLIARRPADVPLRVVYLDSLRRAGRFAELLETVASMPSDTPVEDATVLVEAGWDLRDLDRAEQAEALFRTALELDPEHRGARNVVAQLYSTPEERAALEAAASAVPEPESAVARAVSRLAEGDGEGAYRLLRRVVARAADSEPAWFNLGVAAFRTGRYEEAARAFEASERLDPTRVEAFVIHGAALRELGRCPEALAVLDHAVALRAGLKQAHYYRYLCHRELGDRKLAAEALARYNALD